MIRRVVVLGTLAVLLAGAAVSADKRSEARAQVEFGITVAVKGLWAEAIYRWEKAAEIDPTCAAAFNNLAVAYERQGQLDKAKKAYDRAIELDPKNTLIKQNYDLFKEINERAKGRTAR